MELFLLLKVERTNDVNLCINFKDVIHGVHHGRNALIFGLYLLLHVSGSRFVAQSILVGGDLVLELPNFVSVFSVCYLLL